MKHCRLLLLGLILSSFTIACTKDDPIPSPDSSVTLSCKQPEYLKAGDKVALISPSYFTPMENVEKTAEVLRGWGLEPVMGPNVGKVVDGRYAGTVAERVSDITTLHGLWTRAGVMSIHGTMSSFLAAGGTDKTSTLMRDILLGKVPKYEIPAHPQNVTGKASGILVGGNICTFAPNLGTQADATLGKDIILFIEEVEESMHNIDRQFNILAINGVLDRCKGVILGEFTDCGTEFTFENCEEMLRQYLVKYNIPVLCGFPAGHGDVNLGGPVTIDVRSDGATFQFNIDGEQQTVKTSEITAAKTSLSKRLMLSGKKTFVDNEK